MKTTPQEVTEWAKVGAIGAGVLALGTLLVVRAVRKGQEQATDRQSLQPGTPANYASRLYMAFENDLPFGAGTDEAAVFQIMREIPNRTVWTQIYTAFNNLYRAHLGTRLREELSVADYNQAMTLLTNKPNFNR